MNKIHVNIEVNGDDVEFLCDPRETLLDTGHWLLERRTKFVIHEILEHIKNV